MIQSFQELAGMKGSSGRGWMLRSWAQKPLTHGRDAAALQPDSQPSCQQGVFTSRKERALQGWWVGCASIEVTLQVDCG